MNLTTVCGVLGSVLALSACGGSSSGGATATGGGGNAGQASGGAGTASGGAGTASGGAGTASGGAAQTAAGGSSPMGTGISTTVPGSTVLGNLSDADAQTLCADLVKSSAFKTVDDFECRAEALLAALTSQDMTDSGIQMACQSAFDACTSTVTSSMCMGKPSSACMTTVAEYTKCLADQAASVSSVSAQIPMCSALKAASLTTAVGALSTISTPASCAVVQQKCPEVMGANGMM